MANEFRIKNGAISPNMVITDTTVSTSTSTGALQVSGGAGIVGNVYASAFYGAASGLYNIPGANVIGVVPNAATATVAGTVTNNTQSNITSLGTLTGLTSSGVVSVTNTTPATSTTTGSLKTSGGLGVAGNIYAGAFYGPATGLTSIPGANVSGSVPSATVAGTVTTAAQPNITSLGTLTGLTSSGAISVTDVTTSTTTTTGAVVISGGLGVGGNVNAPVVNATSTTGDITLDGVTSTIASGRTDNVASNPRLDFNSGATTVAYDTRFGSSGGNGVIGGGNAYLLCNTFDIGGKFGYRSGTGSSITQLTSRTTGVTINNVTGRITLVSATTTAGQISTFTVTNSTVTTTDNIIITKFSGSGFYIATINSVTAGSFTISIYTPNAISTAEAPAFNFAVVTGRIN